MPLFACSECNVVENTALSSYWFRAGEGLPLLCSQCDPQIKKWHGRFPRQTVQEGGYVPDRGNFLKRTRRD